MKKKQHTIKINPFSIQLVLLVTEVINMKEEVGIEVNLTEEIASKIALWANNNCKGGQIEYLKMKLGIETILINFSKAIFVYGMAILCGVLFQTFILHSAYFAVRRVSFGLHAKSSAHCTIISVILLVGMSLIAPYIVLSNYSILGLSLIFILCLYRYAPADTEKNPLIGLDRRRKLRKESIVTCLFIIFIALIVPNQMIKSLLVLGIALQIMFILPITYKLLKRGRNNYEKYEEEING
ncbi:accessory gene regulator B family protein [Bacillus tropicus]|uniref:accessory gene regulator B family protein n=1 Tax=Bacillus tropicus TaxID=2026188 RepID=UPI0021BFA957|nr:accessory gene regulator B family protein [Bacillus tropicus]